VCIDKNKGFNMTHTKINRFKLTEQDDLQLLKQQQDLREKARELASMQNHIKDLVQGCVNAKLLIDEATLSFPPTNTKAIKNVIAEQARNNNKLLDAITKLEWFFIQKEIDKSRGK